jgi:pimeloyl-ACP methyl ester carboxylesterase
MASLTLGPSQPASINAPPPPIAIPGSTDAAAATSRIDTLRAIANDPLSTPLERGKALAEADALTGVSSNPILLASTAGSGKTAVSWESRRAGLINQLRTESSLQGAGSPDYARDLSRAADRLQYGAATLPSGTYQAAAPPLAVRSNTRDPNPLRIDTISAQNSRATLANLDAKIAANNVKIDKLNQENRRLAEESRTAFDPDVVKANAASMAFNAAQIKTLEAQNIASGLDRNKVVNDARLQSSKSENGNMYRAVANGVDPKRTPVIFINGVNTDVNRSATQAMELSRTLNVPIDHVVNVSSMDKLVRGGAGNAADTLLRAANPFNPNVTDQRIQQHLTGNGEAAATAANAILAQLGSGKGRVKVIGYSQGGAIATEAFRKVNDVLRMRGFDEGQRAQMLGRIDFLGIGPAAGQRHVSQNYQQNWLGTSVGTIPELRSVRYRSIADANDPIANLLNVSVANSDGRSGRSPASADLGRSTAAIGQMTNPSGILPHLSYFKSYEATDPGSIFNPEMPRALNEWYQGTGVQNLILRGRNTGQ